VKSMLCQNTLAAYLSWGVGCCFYPTQRPSCNGGSIGKSGDPCAGGVLVNGHRWAARATHGVRQNRKASPW